MKFITAALLSSIVIGFAGNIAFAKDPALFSLTAAHFRDSATVEENAIDGKATISTENGFVEHTGLMRMVWNDTFLRGVVDRKTGKKSIEVYAWIIYSGSLRSYETATYETKDGPRSVPATPIGKQVANCAVGDCTYTEHLAFSVDEALLRELAAQPAAGKPKLWPFRFAAKSGPDYVAGLSNAEIAGFLAKMDEYLNTLPVVAANTDNASLKLDLGIGGMPVEATPEQPRRAGILITAVNRGSIAHKSGVIIGDILYEFDGHPIKGLADLQSAVAGCAANSVVAIKLYRGTDAMAVSAQF